MRYQLTTVVRHCRRQGRASSQRAPKSLTRAHNYSIASGYCRPTLYYASWVSPHMQVSECVELNFDGRVLSSNLLFHCPDCCTASVAEERRHGQSQRTRRRNRSESLHSNWSICVPIKVFWSFLRQQFCVNSRKNWCEKPFRIWKECYLGE